MSGLRSRATVVAAILAGVCLLLMVSGCALGQWSGDGPVEIGRPATTNVSTTPPPAVPPEPAGVLAPPTAGALIGVYRPPAPFDISGLDSYSTISDKPPAILMWYQPWTENGPRDFDPAACVSCYDRGAVPMITWEPWDPGTNANYLENPTAQPEYKLQSIVDGDWDEYIREFARGVRAVRGPVMIRPMHEMNGNWYPWCGTVNGNTPALYIAAWRHIHALFAEEKATNVTWVWSTNHESVPDVPANSFGAYYPGDAYVDWVSMSGFNWGTTSRYSNWSTFDNRYREPLAYLKTLKKPIVIAEFGCVEQGGDKAAWILDAYKRISTEHPEVKGVVYYDHYEKSPNMVQDWRITSSSFSTDAYRAAVAEPYYRAGPMTSLEEWTAGLNSLNWQYLRSLKPVY